MCTLLTFLKLGKNKLLKITTPELNPVSLSSGEG
jgi:hypothetical protein